MSQERLDKFTRRSLRKGIGGPIREVADNTGDDGDLVLAIRNLNDAVDTLNTAVALLALDIAAIRLSTANLKPNAAVTGIIATVA